MKKNLVSILLITFLFTTISLAQAKKGISIPFVNKTLPNGLEVIVLPDSSVPLVTVELAARNGSFTEPPEFNGLSHLYEHMFFKPNLAVGIFRCEFYADNFANPRAVAAYRASGCNRIIPLKKQIGDVSYLKTIDQMGIVNNATTREEVVNYYFTTTSPHLSTAIRFINDSIRYPTFNEQDLENEKKVVLGEIDRNLGNPFFYLRDTLQDKLYYKHPTRKKPLGTRATVSGATTEMMKTIQSRYYVPNNTALIVTGDVNVQEVFKLAEQNFGSWKRREIEPFKEFPLVEHPPLTKSSGEIVEQPIKNVMIQVGWHGPSIGKDNEATYAADVFSYILGQPNSKFHRALVDSGLAVGVDITYYTQRNVGPITMTLITSPEKAKQALKVAYEQIEQFDDPNYFTNQELENAKTLLEARDLFEREKLTDYAHTLAFWWSSTGIEYFRGYHKSLRAVSRNDINQYVRTYIKGKKHVGVALLSPASQAKAQLTERDLIGK